MNLELSAQERQYLEQIVSRYLSELYHEINHTDAADFREDLKNRETVLKTLHRKLQSESQ